MHSLLFALAIGVPGADPAALPPALAVIKSVGREGSGNEAAAAAWKTVAASGAAGLLPTLSAFEGASPAAANWLRSAVDAIVEAERKAGRPLPMTELQEFATDAKRPSDARRIAFELVTTGNESLKVKLLAGMVTDPNMDLRRDAIAAGIEKLKAVPDEAKKAGYQTLYAAARDEKQVTQLAELLTPLGITPDAVAHFGFVTRWHVVGPFDNAGNKGFDTAYSPEAGIDLGVTYTAKEGKSVGWKAFGTTQPKGHYATLDLNKELGKSKSAVMYAHAVVESATGGPVELRAACPTSLKIFVNGKAVFARDEYHHGNSFDQHAGAATLKAGRNELLVKICQNNQNEPWAQAWEFEVRICDSTGGAVPFKLVSPEAK
jgi:hypothetical protein